MSILLQSPDADLFASGASVLVNPVNTMGVAGAGLAKEFRRRWPASCRRYQAACANGRLRPGGIFVDLRQPEAEVDVTIIYVATKQHWRNNSSPQWVCDGAMELREWAEDHGQPRIACPALGAGLGGLPWPKVHAMIEFAFGNYAGELLLFPPR